MKKESKTDWSRINALGDEDIDLSESPELGHDFFEEAMPWPGTKRQITLRLDQEVVDFFKSQGRGYQTAINNVLHRYVETHRKLKGVSPDSGDRSVHDAEVRWTKGGVGRSAGAGKDTDGRTAGKSPRKKKES